MFFAATPTDLRHIVLSYLCDNCHADTAQVFARDSSTRELDKDGDEVLASGEGGMLDAQVVRKVQSRKEIKLKILSGEINEAIEMLRLYFPAVLAPADNTCNSPRYDPAHLFLNLRIQNFIEQSRTLPLPWPPEICASSSTPTQQSSPMTMSALLPDMRCSSSEDEERKNRLLNLMHELYMLTHELVSPMDRATYLTELSTVGGLLVYPVPEKSKEMREFLGMTRREAVAEQINEALLYRCSVSVPGIAELSIRQTTLLFATLSSLGRKLPPHDSRPAGLEVLLGKNSSLHTLDPNPKITKEREIHETVPTFELKHFLSSGAS